VAKSSFWKADWFFGLVITIIFLIYSNSAAIQGIERWAYDMGVRSTDRTPADNISVIAIDDQSIANLGRWPWSREIHAQILEELGKAGAKVVAPAIIFSESQRDPGAQYLDELQQFYLSSVLGGRLADDIVELGAHIAGTDISGLALAKKDKLRPAYLKLADMQTFYKDSVLNSQATEDLAKLAKMLKDASQALDRDGALASSISQAGNVVLPLLFELGSPQGRPDSSLPDYIQRNRLENISDLSGAAAAGSTPTPAITSYFPIEELGISSAGIAHLNQTLDVDGGIRTEPLVIDYYGEYYPSFSMLIAAKSLNLRPEDIQILLGEGVKLRNLVIGTDEYLNMNTFFYSDSEDGTQAFATDSFFDVISGKIPYGKYRDKIVLIGPTKDIDLGSKVY